MEEHTRHSCIDMARPMLPPVHCEPHCMFTRAAMGYPMCIIDVTGSRETAWATTSPKWGTNTLLTNWQVRKIILPSSHTSQECNVLLTPPSSVVMSVLRSPLTSHSQACHQIPIMWGFYVCLFFFLAALGHVRRETHPPRIRLFYYLKWQK